MNGPYLSEKTGNTFLSLALVVDLYLLNETHCFLGDGKICIIFFAVPHMFTLLRLFIFRVIPIPRLYGTYGKTQKETVTHNL